MVKLWYPPGRAQGVTLPSVIFLLSAAGKSGTIHLQLNDFEMTYSRLLCLLTSRLTLLQFIILPDNSFTLPILSYFIHITLHRQKCLFLLKTYYKYNHRRFWSSRETARCNLGKWALRIGIPKETYPGERRVAVVPDILPRLTAAGFQISVEEGAGLHAGFSDQLYADKGARIITAREAVFKDSDIILQVHCLDEQSKLSEQDLGFMHRGLILAGLLEPLTSPGSARDLAAHEVSAFALELMPRIARAQSMDVLSSMATITGYKAVLLAADHLTRMFPLLMTAAGTILPARVFVLGAGVAGLQAISTARRLGANVQAYDIRPAAREQVQSLGAKFVEFPIAAEDAETQGGYAKAMDKTFYQRQQELMKSIVGQSDVVITAAAAFGSRAPILITEDMMKSMPAGSVIVDLVAEQGGNCELSDTCRIVNKHGVTVIAPLNLASEIPYHSSLMYANNITSFILHITKNGKAAPRKFDLTDEIVRETMVTRNGAVVQPVILKLLAPGTAGEQKVTGGG
jgi:H+-translocating NAD(P) transhydrogenase subunit alpha